MKQYGTCQISAFNTDLIKNNGFQFIHFKIFSLKIVLLDCSLYRKVKCFGLQAQPGMKQIKGVEVCDCNLAPKPSRILMPVRRFLNKMVNVFSLYAPLIYQLKLACLISAGLLRAFMAAPTSTNMTFLCKECASLIHQHPPQLLHPGFP